MRKMAILAMMATLLTCNLQLRAQEPPKMPEPQKEHTWLTQLAGEWETEARLTMEPGKPPIISKGVETTRILGGFWLVSEIKAECMGMPMTGLMTVGYDVAKKKYTGTWICSADGYLWKYEGTAEGNVLTLETEGPCPANPGTVCKMRDVIEVKDKDTKVLTSFIQVEDGKWVTFMTMTAKRKK